MSRSYKVDAQNYRCYSHISECCWSFLSWLCFKYRRWQRQPSKPPEASTPGAGGLLLLCLGMDSLFGRQTFSFLSSFWAVNDYCVKSQSCTLVCYRPVLILMVLAVKLLPQQLHLSLLCQEVTELQVGCCLCSCYQNCCCITRIHYTNNVPGIAGFLFNETLWIQVCFLLNLSSLPQFY